MSDDDIQKIAPSARAPFATMRRPRRRPRRKIILDGVKAERWRILVGDDAHKLDERVRQTPEEAYTPEFYESYRPRSAGSSASRRSVLMGSEPTLLLV